MQRCNAVEVMGGGTSFGLRESHVQLRGTLVVCLLNFPFDICLDVQ